MKPISVLLVDDNPTFLRIVERYLKAEEEITVVGAAEGGDEALALVHRLKPDIVLTDLAMPKVSGMETILRMRAAWPKMGIIALTLLDTTGGPNRRCRRFRSQRCPQHGFTANHSTGRGG